METRAFCLSFIIASIDRDQQLQQCITSIEKAHEYKPNIPIEILVIIQKTKQKKNIQLNHPVLTSFYYIDKVGLSAARNFAIEKSKGAYLVFIDDDATVQEDFVEVLFEEIKSHDKVNAFCGRLIDPVKNVPFSPLFSNTTPKYLDRVDFQTFMGSAHVLKKEIFEKIGCYDECFGVGAKYFGSEESDMFFRLKMANEQVLYLPTLVFFHLFPVVPPSYVYKYAFAVGAVLAKSCIKDKINFITYSYLVLQITIRAFIRMIQKMLFGGKYVEMDKKYHYGLVIKGTFVGIKDYVLNR